jgi:hypothetical protein
MLVTVADNATFDQWLDYYTARFAGINDNALHGYWYMYGRNSETPGTPREQAAWAAVNAEMDSRDMQP